jgi:hypothetical protein
VDDLPLLIAELREMDVPTLLDQACKVHGNWHGRKLKQETCGHDCAWRSAKFARWENRSNANVCREQKKSGDWQCSKF